MNSCSKCGCTAFKPMQDSLYSCFNCGKLIDLAPAPMPMPPKWLPAFKKTHCTHGHERTPENVTKNGACKICQKNRLNSPEYKAYQAAYRGKSINGIEGIKFGRCAR